MFDPSAGYPRVVPYLRFVDPDGAVRWLESVLGARLTLGLRLPDGRLGHAELAVGDSVLAIGLAAAARPVDDQITRATLATMTLVFVDDVDDAVARLEEHGGRLVDPPTEQPWGLRQAIVQDPEGNLWEPSQFVRDVPPEAWGATPTP
jgi:PhnB protein